jgi:hypothetical protein
MLGLSAGQAGESRKLVNKPMFSWISEKQWKENYFYIVGTLYLGRNAARKILRVKNFDVRIRNRTHGLSGCSAVPPTNYATACLHILS